MEYGFDFFVLGLVSLFGIWTWKDIASRAASSSANRIWLIIASVSLSLNLVLVISFFATDFVYPSTSPSHASLRQHGVMLAGLWVSRIGLLVSATTLLFTIRAEPGISRKLCVWGSMLGIAFWFMAYSVEAELLRVYSIAHQ